MVSKFVILNVFLEIVDFTVPEIFFTKYYEKNRHDLRIHFAR